jgi:outer membrane protein assembly factor BamB
MDARTISCDDPSRNVPDCCDNCFNRLQPQKGLRTGSVKRLASVVFMLAAASALYGSVWPGFQGLEKGGCGDSTPKPWKWSPSQNVAWKTAIPGRGHSSPILSGDAVYLTTAYEKLRLSPLAKIWMYAIPLLALVCAISGIGLWIHSIEARESGRERLWQHARVFLFAQLLTAVILISLFGRYLPNPEDDAVRHWLIAIVLMLSCLMLSSLFVPLRSRQHLAAGLVSLAFTVLVLATLTHRGSALGSGSLKGLLVMGASFLPLAAGLLLSVAHFVSRRRQSAIDHDQDDAKSSLPVMWHFMLTGGFGLVSVLVLFFLLLFRAAEYQMPDSYIWRNRVRPEINWWCVGLFLTLVLIAVAGWYWTLVRGRATNKLPLQGILLGAASLLGIVFFIRSSSLEKPKESVRAIVSINRNNGKVLWTCEGLVGRNRTQNRTVTHASPTPATDGERIYGYFGEDGLICVSPAGKLLWKRTEPLFRGTHGVGTSPVVKDNVLVIVSDVKESKDAASCITAFDGVSGKPLWKDERKSHKVDAAYATPLIREMNGRQVVIVHGWHDIKGYDLKTGEELWSYPIAHEGMHLVASPVTDGERLYVTSAKRVIALDLSKLGTNADPLLWSRSVPGEKSSTPVVVDGLIFLVTEPGQVFCLDAQTGEIAWKERLRGSYFSSVLAIGGKVFFTNEAGQTTVVAVDRQFQQHATNTLNEPIYAAFAPVDSQLFVRTTSHLYCLQESRRLGLP